MSRIIAPTPLFVYLSNVALQCEFVIGSTFFLIKLAGHNTYEVWLTPKRAHFSILDCELSPEARQLVENDLPRFRGLFTADPIKLVSESPRLTIDLSNSIDRVNDVGCTSEPVNGFYVMGNHVVLAGPLFFETDAYGRENWGYLKDISIEFARELVELNFICNDKPWLTPDNFSDFVVKSSEIVPSYPSISGQKMMQARKARQVSLSSKPERALSKVGLSVVAQTDLTPFGSVDVDGERFNARAFDSDVAAGDFVNIFEAKGYWLHVRKANP